MYTTSYSVPATPLQGYHTQPNNQTNANQTNNRPIGQGEMTLPTGSSDAPSGGYVDGLVQYYDHLSQSVPTTPAIYSGKTQTYQPSPDAQHTIPPQASTTDPAAPAAVGPSLTDFVDSVTAEQKRMTQLSSSIQQLSGTHAATPFNSNEIKSQLPSSIPPPPRPPPTHPPHAAPASLGGRPLITGFSPSPPPPQPRSNAYMLPPRPGPMSSPLPPVSSLPPTPSMPTTTSKTLSSSLGPEKSPAIQNLNDSFASVASDTNLNSPVALSPTSLLSPSALPSSPTMLKEVIRHQQNKMDLAGKYGSELINEKEALQRANAVLKAQVNELQEAASLSSGQVAAIRNLSDYIRSEFQAANSNERAVGEHGTTYSFTGQLSTDLATFQSFIRTQRKLAREQSTTLQTELEKLQHQCSSQQASIQSLTAASGMWTTLQQQYNTLQQLHDELEINHMELQTKIKIQSSQHQTMTQLLTEQLHAAKEERQTEIEKMRHIEQQKRDTLEQQVNQLKRQLAQMATNASQQSQLHPPTTVDVESQPIEGVHMAVPSDANRIVKPSIPSTSLESDLATANSDHSSPPPPQTTPTSTSLSSGELARLSNHFDVVMDVETQRQETRDSWHQAESLWFFERARLRDIEEQAVEILREERQKELAAMATLADAKQTQRIIDELKEQLRQSQEREASLRDSQQQLLTESVAALTKQLNDKEEELIRLRTFSFEPSANQPTGLQTPTKYTHHDQDELDDLDILSTPTVRAAREITTTRKYTPQIHSNSVLSTDSSIPTALPPQSLITYSTTHTSKPDSKLRTSVREVQSLTHMVLSEVRISRRSTPGRWFILGLFFIQFVFVLIWFILTNGGASILSDHPIIQAGVKWLMETSTQSVVERFQS